MCLCEPLNNKQSMTMTIKQWIQLGLLGVGVLFVRFYAFLVLGRSLYFGDNYSLSIPTKIFTDYWLKQGVLPLWNPLIFSGIPWLADISNSIMYPSTAIFFLFNPATALNLTLMLHLMVAIVGMYLLTLRWTKHHWASVVAAMLWVASTHVTGSLNNLVTIQSIVWLPWLAWAGLEVGRKPRATIIFSVLVLLQMLAGYPIHTIYGIGLAVLISLHAAWGNLTWWQWLRGWTATGFITLGLTAVAWLPFGRLFLASTRVAQSNDQASVGSLNPAMLIKSVIPYFFDKPIAGMKWGPAWSGQPNSVFYVTWLGLVVIGTTLWQAVATLKPSISWRVWFSWLKTPINKDVAFFSLFTLLTLVLALGSYLPGYAWLQTVIPLFRVSRYPSMVLMLTNLILALWVGVGLSHLQPNRFVVRILPWLMGLALVVGMVGLGLVRWQFSSVWPQLDKVVGGRLSTSQFHTLDRDRVIADVITMDVVVVSGLGIMGLWALLRRRWLIVAIIVALDMLYNTQGMLFFTDSRVYPTYAEIASQSQHDQQAPFTQLFTVQDRVLIRNFNRPYTDFGSYWEAMVVRAPFSDSFVDRYELITGQHAVQLRDGLTPDWNIVYGVRSLQGYTTLLPQQYTQLWQTKADVGINFIDQVEPTNPLVGQWAVKYYVVDTWFKQDEAEQDYLASLPIAAEYQGWKVYELPALSRFRFEDDSTAELTTVTETPNQLNLMIDNQHDQHWLTVADSYDSNWRARVNDQPVVVENWDGMRRIPIAPGINQIVMWYEPRLVWIGAGVSAMTLVVVGGYWLLSSRRSRQKISRQ